MSIIRPHNEETRALSARLISEGAIIAFGTDTFYGLGADPFNQSALRSLRGLKGREDEKAILVVVGEAAQAERFFDGTSQLFRAVSARHWPGPLTLVAKARPELHEELTADTGTIGVRLPADESVRSFVRECGGALTATSANPAGEPPARTAAEVARYFPEGVALIVDFGEARADRPSTVLQITDSGHARLLREGAVERLELQKTLESVGADLLA
jgi:L-threonylcarbamoyladenylate synthase